jgi:hypothetical protein
MVPASCSSVWGAECVQHARIRRHHYGSAQFAVRISTASEMAPAYPALDEAGLLTDQTAAVMSEPRLKQKERAEPALSVLVLAGLGLTTRVGCAVSYTQMRSPSFQGDSSYCFRGPALLSAVILSFASVPLAYSAQHAEESTAGPLAEHRLNICSLPSVLLGEQWNLPRNAFASPARPGHARGGRRRRMQRPCSTLTTLRRHASGWRTSCRNIGFSSALRRWPRCSIVREDNRRAIRRWNGAPNGGR